MNQLDILEQQRYNDVLNLEIAYSNLYNAYYTDSIDKMRTAIVNYKSNFPLLSMKTQTECNNVFYENGIFTFRTDVALIKLTFNELKMNTEGCMNAALSELNRLHYYQSNYTYAVRTLYSPSHPFRETEVLNTKDGNSLTVAELLKVSKYAIDIAKAISPDNKDFDKASAAISVFQGIDLALNNKPEDKPINKMLHLANDFLISVVKSRIKDDEGKSSVTATSILVDLVIDFFTKG